MLRYLLPVFALVVAARADLTWDKPVQELHAVPEDKSVVAHFTFKNTGKEPVTIKQVKTSCGCTTASLAKNTYAPGETGDIEVKFTFHFRRGLHRKIMSVMSEDKQEWKLDLRCWIHEPLTVSPTLVYWKIGSAAEAKTVKLTARPGETIGIKSVKSTSPRIKTSLTTVKAGEEFAVTVTPTDTAQELNAMLVIETDVPSAAGRNYKVFARIK